MTEVAGLWWTLLQRVRFDLVFLGPPVGIPALPIPSELGRDFAYKVIAHSAWPIQATETMYIGYLNDDIH